MLLIPSAHKAGDGTSVVTDYSATMLALAFMVNNSF